MILLALVACGEQETTNGTGDDAGAAVPSQAPGSTETPRPGHGSTEAADAGPALSLLDMDLTGNWLSRTRIDRYLAATGAYHSSQFVRERYILIDDEQGVSYRGCRMHAGEAVEGRKTAEHLYISGADDGFRLQQDGSLVKLRRYRLESDPEAEFISTRTLQRSSDTLSLDSGTFVLHGPVSHTEHAHVCAWDVTYGAGQRRTIEIISLYGDGMLSIHLTVYDKAQAGEYRYSASNAENPLRLAIQSTSSQFTELVGGPRIDPVSATVRFIEYADSRVSGTFELTDGDEREYHGEFEAYF